MPDNKQMQAWLILTQAALNKIYEDFGETPLGKRLNETLSQQIARLQALDRHDVAALIQYEMFILKAEEQNANSREQLNSLKAGISEADHALKTVQELDQGNYEIIHNAIGLKKGSDRDPSGLPKDGCRKFLASQKARLSNALTANISTGHKDVIRQRMVNLAVAEKSYKERQIKELTRLGIVKKG